MINLIITITKGSATTTNAPSLKICGLQLLLYYSQVIIKSVCMDAIMHLKLGRFLRRVQTKVTQGSTVIYYKALASGIGIK